MGMWWMSDAIGWPSAVSGDWEEGRGCEGREPGAEPGYVAHVALDSARMVVDGREEALSPGMAVTAEIKTGRRSAIVLLAFAVAAGTGMRGGGRDDRISSRQKVKAKYDEVVHSHKENLVQ